MKRTLLIAASALTLGLAAAPAWATAPDDKDKNAVEELVVTGSMRVRQGGAQDINHFRGAVDGQDVPFPDSFTAEGLLGDYDLEIAGVEPCAQTFCLTGEAMRASLVASPEDRLLVGLGFSTSIEAATWKRQPLNLVVVADKSGSMAGSPLALVRQSLTQIVGQLTAADQISIVLYGDTSHVHLAPTRVTEANRAAILQRISEIASNGSTFMEAGLRVGYDTAFASQDSFSGATRLMLFTDERPNVGRTDAAGFKGMAKAASLRGVGLTTIGVGVQFDAALATAVASERGGNLYFLRDPKDVEEVFHAKLDTMVSELAYDLKLSLRAQPGYRISGVYGVPGDQLRYDPDGSISLTVPTAFLSVNGGGLFVGVARQSEHLPDAPLGEASLLDVDLTYVSALDGRTASDRLAVAAPHGAPSRTMRLGEALIDEYLGLKAATNAYHKGDEEAAYQSLRHLAAKLEATPDPRLAREREMVGKLLTKTAFLSGHAGEPPKGQRYLGVTGSWDVVGTLGEPPVRLGDRLRLAPGSDAIIYRKRMPAEPDHASYEVNNQQILLTTDRAMVFAYRVSADRLTLVDPDTGTTINLRRTVARD